LDERLRPRSIPVIDSFRTMTMHPRNPMPGWADTIEPLLGGVLSVVGRRRFASAWPWAEGLALTVASGIGPQTRVQLVPPGGEPLEAEVVGVDEGTDLALLRAAGLAAPTVAMEAAVPRLGDAVAVLGRLPSGELQADFGYVGLVGPRWRTWKGAALEHRIRLDGGLQAGLPGGPVVDAAGRVIGLASAGLSRHHGIVVPTVAVVRVAQALAAGGCVPRAHLGVALQGVAARLEGRTQGGLLVTHVAEEGAAARAGVLVGDVIVEAAGRPTTALTDLREVLDGLDAGATVPLALARGGTRVDLLATPWPAQAGAAA
jgi:S1-C subfamily serine protease